MYFVPGKCTGYNVFFSYIITYMLNIAGRYCETTSIKFGR